MAIGNIYSRVILRSSPNRKLNKSSTDSPREKNEVQIFIYLANNGQKNTTVLQRNR